MNHRLLRAADYPVMPWKNGAGSTREILRDAGDGLEGFGWRLSIADVGAPGPFSAFSGYQRVITVLEGEGMRLTVDGEPSRELRALDAFAFDGASDLGPGTSNEVRVVVRQIALLRPTHAGDTTRVRSGTLLVLTTTVRPSPVDLPRASVRYAVARRVGGAWQPAGTYDVTADASGRARLELDLAVGTWSVRAQARPTSANANSVWTPLEFYEVVPARPG